MRQFLTAFFCLSMFAMVQNVVVATPLAGDSEHAIGGATSKASGSRVVASTALLGGDVPEPATMVLLVAGLSGLTAVGGRNQEQKKRVSA